MIAVILGLGLQVGEIGAGVGLAIPLAPTNLAARDGRQVLGLLGLCAVLEHHRAQHADAKPEQGRANVATCHFLAQHQRFVPGESGAAVSLGPGRDGPAARDHACQPKSAVGMLEHRIPPAPYAFLFGHWRAH